MQCKNHPGVLASARCAGCAEPFCDECLVEIQGQHYCASCKVLALKGAAPVVEEATEPCKEANNALTLAIVGLFCFGIILGPLAISSALKAKRMIEANPRLTGSGKATAALIIGIADLFFFLVAILANIARISSGR